MAIKHKQVSTNSEFNLFKQAIINARLPHSDLDVEKQSLLTFYEGDNMIGTGGLEIVGRVGLLRSVSVVAEHRNKNIGKQITNTLLTVAREKKLDEVYLLTETAKDFFKKLNFEEVSRENAPQVIKSTTEFASVCPSTASCLMLKL